MKTVLSSSSSLSSSVVGFKRKLEVDNDNDDADDDNDDQKEEQNDQSDLQTKTYAIG